MSFRLRHFQSTHNGRLLFKLLYQQQQPEPVMASISKRKRGSYYSASGLPSKDQRISAVNHALPHTDRQLSPPSANSALGVILDPKRWKACFRKKKKPKPGDWLDEHESDRRGQPFRSWYKQTVRYPSPKQNIIGLLTVGKFDINLNIARDGTAAEHKSNQNGENLFLMLSNIIEAYYGMKTEILPSIKAKDVTSRVNDECGVKQLKTTSIHNKLSSIIVRNRRLFCLMGVSIIDLYP